MKPDFRAVIDGLDAPASVVAIFDNQAAAEQFFKVAAEAELGLCVNMSASVEGAEQCCKLPGSRRHSVGYSLGFEGETEKLPNTQALLLSTMCGHGMISHQPGQEDDRLGEGRPPDAGRSGHLYDALLLLRRVQSGPGEAHSRGSPNENGVTWFTECHQIGTEFDMRRLQVALTVSSLLVLSGYMWARSPAQTGFLLVAVKGDTSVGIVDSKTMQKIAEVPEGGVTGHELTVSPDGQKAYVPIYGNSGVGEPGTDGHNMVVIDFASRKVVGNVDWGKGVRPHDPVFGPKNGLLYVTTELNRSISIIDPSNATHHRVGSNQSRPVTHAGHFP